SRSLGMSACQNRELQYINARRRDSLNNMGNNLVLESSSSFSSFPADIDRIVEENIHRRS
ncbi:hypothetical protein MKW94_027785, partial [Papaver nudicaule]|nr:hypothetical protein [Papaver nudicaule]